MQPQEDSAVMRKNAQRKEKSPGQHERESSHGKSPSLGAVTKMTSSRTTGQGGFSAEGLTRERRFLDRPRIPAHLERLIEAYIEKKTGKLWDDPVVLSRMRAAILAQKREYWKESKKRRISYQTGYQVFAYLAYQLPVFFVQFQHLLFELARQELIGPDLRVFDAGTGPGVVPLAVIDFLKRTGEGSAILFGVDASEENSEAYRFLVPAYAGGDLRIQVESPLCADLRTLSPDQVPEDIDLLVFSNVLNEVRDITPTEKAELLTRYAASLAEHGTIAVIEPADLTNATSLRRITMAATDTGPLGVYAPCAFLWGERCTPDSCWSFIEHPSVQSTRLMRALAQDPEPYRYLNTDIKFSYAVLRKDGLTRCRYRVYPGAPFLRLSKLPLRVNHRVNVVGVVMSGDIGDPKHLVMKFCDGTMGTPVYVVMPRYQRSRATSHLLAAMYGDVLELRQVLVRYNDRYRAYNLLITGASQVLVP